MYLLCQKVYDELCPIAVFSTTDKIVDYADEHGLDKYGLVYGLITIDPETDMPAQDVSNLDYAEKLWEDIS